MRLIAISSDEKHKVVLCGDRYLFQTKNLFGWSTLKDTKEEWLASKWILQFNLKVAEDYPSISEIRMKQKQDETIS